MSYRKVSRSLDMHLLLLYLKQNLDRWIWESSTPSVFETVASGKGGFLNECGWAWANELSRITLKVANEKNWLEDLRLLSSLRRCLPLAYRRRFSVFQRKSETCRWHEGEQAQHVFQQWREDDLHPLDQTFAWAMEHVSVFDAEVCSGNGFRMVGRASILLACQSCMLQ